MFAIIPTADSSLIVERVSPIFMNMRDWLPKYSSYATFVPDARFEVICYQYPSSQDQKRQTTIYYVNVHPRASWDHLAWKLYQFQQNRIIEIFKAQLPKPKGNQCDCTDSVGVLCIVIDSVHSALCEAFTVT